MTTLSIRKQIAQSFMAAAYTHNDEPNAEIIGLIQDLGIGGIIFMQGNPHRSSQGQYDLSKRI